MNGKLSNIGKWVFGLLALITVGLAVYFYLDLADAGRTTLFLNWGYILIGLGILIALISVFFTAGVKGVNGKTLLIVIIAFVLIAAVAYFMSRGTFSWALECPKCKDLGPEDYTRMTKAWVVLGLNFFYVTLGVAFLSILFSVLYKAVKK